MDVKVSMFRQSNCVHIIDIFILDIHFCTVVSIE